MKVCRALKFGRIERASDIEAMKCLQIPLNTTPELENVYYHPSRVPDLIQQGQGISRISVYGSLGNFAQDLEIPFSYA
jgi:hypothetical protein